MNLQKIVTGQYVELPKMLDARERRQFVQQKLLSEHQLPLISFTLNIVGPIKVFPLASPYLRGGTFHDPNPVYGMEASDHRRKTNRGYHRI